MCTRERGNETPPPAALVAENPGDVMREAKPGVRLRRRDMISVFLSPPPPLPPHSFISLNSAQLCCWPALPYREVEKQRSSHVGSLGPACARPVGDCVFVHVRVCGTLKDTPVRARHSCAEQEGQVQCQMDKQALALALAHSHHSLFNH